MAKRKSVADAMDEIDGNGAVATATEPKAATKVKKEVEPKIVQVAIDPPQFEEFTVRVRGTTPLVVHRLGEKVRKELIHKQTKDQTKSKKRPLRDPEQEFRDSLYVLPDGKYYGVKAAGFKLAMVSACRLVADIPMTQARMLFYVYGEGPEGLVRITDAKGKPAQPSCYEDFVRVPPRTGTRMPCWRGMFEPGWMADLRIRINDRNMISRHSVVNLLARAGMMVGICEGRPESTGAMDWGTFEVLIEKD